MSTGAVRARARVIGGLVACAALAAGGAAPPVSAVEGTPPLTFADGDRSAELAGEVPRQRYQFSSPTTVTYDRDTITGDPTTARVYVADVGNHIVRVLDLRGREIGRLDDGDTALAADSPAAAVPRITAPLGITFLSRGEAVDDRLAGLYVNDVGTHRIHFFRTSRTDPDRFRYVTSFGRKGSGSGQQLTLPRNATVLPQGLLYVSDEFNHRVKGFRLDPTTWSATLLTTEGWQDASGRYVGTGPVLPGEDRHYGTDSTHYDDYAGEPAKREGFRIPQGQTFWQSPDGSRTYLYVADNGNNRVKIYSVDTATGALTLVDMLSRFVHDGEVGHLKRPRGLRTDRDGNLFVADTYGGRVLRFENLASSGRVAYRTQKFSDARATWAYGRLGLHQVEMRTAATAATEDEALQLPNDAVPVLRPDGSRYTEDVLAWGAWYYDAPVVLVSDTGNHRVKKCWEDPDQGTIVRCSVSEGVGGVSDHEFWGHPRTLPGQLHYAAGMDYLPATGSQQGRLLVSDTPNSVIESYGLDGSYLGRFGGGQLSYGVSGLSVFGTSTTKVAALMASDASLPWPYVGDSSLRVYGRDGTFEEVYNLGYRTGGFGVPKIAFTNQNHPVAVDVVSEGDGYFGVFVTTYGDYLWRLTYDAYAGSLRADWVVGGRDPAKGVEAGSHWDLGPDFFTEGAPGTFDQIQDVTAGGGRVYAVDRRNQRIQVYDAATGRRLGRIGAGGGTYDHPTGIVDDELFLPHGVHLDRGTGSFLVGDGFNFVARRYADPSSLGASSDGQIRPRFDGYWLDPALGTRAGGLFATQHVLRVGRYVFVDSLISNRITRFDADLSTPAG